ncbi:MAG: hypothetical protein IPM24_02895 [Bryobacterales bacterium]|nr:hypothetical protein [Bryobacterales bacterium]
MTKHVISMLTLLVVSLIAGLTLLFDTREAGRLTGFGYAVAALTAASFALGLVAEIHSIREKAREESEQRARRTEQRQQLAQLEAEVKAGTRPLLPISVFFTLRHATTPNAVERAFAGTRGFKTSKSDLLRLVGTARLGGPLGYHSIEQTAQESHCVLEGEALAKLIREHSGFGDSVIRFPVACTLEFYFSADGSLPVEPTLVLKRTFTTGRPNDVKRLELFDTVIFQDSFVRQWNAQTLTGQNWSIADLRGARLRLRLDLLGEYGPVELHELQIFFGPLSAMHGIRFPTEVLSGAAFKTNESPLLRPSNDLARQFFASYVLELDVVLTEPILAECLTKVVQPAP